MDNIEETINCIIGNILKDNESPVKEFSQEYSLRKDLGFTSMDMLELIGEIEDHSAITIKNSELPSVETVKDLYDLAKSKIEG